AETPTTRGCGRCSVGSRASSSRTGWPKPIDGSRSRWPGASRAPPLLASTTMIPRFDVLGVHVNAIDIPTATDEIGRWIDRREPHYVCVTGVHGVMESQSDAELLAIHNRSGLTTPDGMPMVWAGSGPASPASACTART